MPWPAVPGRVEATPLERQLVEQIRADGPLPFERFMAACLYDQEHGYYAQPEVTTGRGGDFATAPDTGPLFGATVARAIGAFATEDPCQLVEVGPGAGRLMDDLLEHLPAEATEVLEVVLVDPFEVHHPRLLETLDRHGATVQVVADLAQVQPGRTFVVMNELLDALPVHPVARTEEGWQLLHVGLDDDGQLTEAWDPCPDEVATFCQEHAASLPPGHRYEASLATSSILGELARIVDPGVVLAFDYGGLFQDIWPQRTDGTLRGFREHRVVDPLSRPGLTDITYDVDFTMVQAEAKARGLRPAAYGGQERLLVHLGLVEVARSMGRVPEIKDLLVPGGFGGRFQALALSCGGGAAQADLKVDLDDSQIWMQGARGLLSDGDLGFFR